MSEREMLYEILHQTRKISKIIHLLEVMNDSAYRT